MNNHKSCCLYQVTSFLPAGGQSLQHAVSHQWQCRSCMWLLRHRHHSAPMPDCLRLSHSKMPVAVQCPQPMSLCCSANKFCLPAAALLGALRRCCQTLSAAIACGRDAAACGSIPNAASSVPDRSTKCSAEPLMARKDSKPQSSCPAGRSSTGLQRSAAGVSQCPVLLSAALYALYARLRQCSSASCVVGLALFL